MTLKQRIISFSELGSLLRNALDGKPGKVTSDLEALIFGQQFRNPWFTPDNVRRAVRAIADELIPENLRKWTDAYNIPDYVTDPLNVGVIMAGNIPLVGFHDFISVLITGNKIIAKPSSKDEDLISFTGKLLSKIDPQFTDRMEFQSGQLKSFEAVIATGSNNSSRYFEYYFGKYPCIIRKNRNSIAVIEGDETEEELSLLGDDIFSYFGLGCRNVSKLLVPSGYDINNLTRSWSSYSGLIDHQKYANNYDYHKAVFLVNKNSFVDTGFILLKENRDLTSPVAVLNFEYYNSLGDVEEVIKTGSDRIQCVISRKHIPFGMSQSPKLWDYADGIDTIEFLLKKNRPMIL